MIKPVRLFTDKILYKPTELITDFIGVDNIASDLIESMLAYKGVGLASNQIGVDKNIAALYLENKTKIIVVANLTNMRYNKDRGTEIQNEGCLSCPGVSIAVKRYLEVSIDCQRLNGDKVEMTLEGYDARIVQHEYDHILGKLIINNVMKL